MNSRDLAALGEFGLISRMTAKLRDTLAPGVVGGGDDCAIVPLEKDRSLVLTTDTLVEGKHFRWDFTTPEELGWKVLAVSLSDLAAAGAVPVAALITAQLRSEIDPRWIEAVFDGIAAIAKKYGCSVVGGDMVSSPTDAFGAAVCGFAAAPLTRSGIQPGDELWVSGKIGGGGLGLALRSGEVRSEDFVDGGIAALERFNRPVPRLELGRLLVEQRIASAAIDISDGFFQDAGHLAVRSGVDLRIRVDQVPLFETSWKNWTALHACSAGDDYELLFAAKAGDRRKVEAAAKQAETPIQLVGGAVEAAQQDCGRVVVELCDGRYSPLTELLSAAGISPSGGFDHFR